MKVHIPRNDSGFIVCFARLFFPVLLLFFFNSQAAVKESSVENHETIKSLQTVDMPLHIVEDSLDVLEQFASSLPMEYSVRITEKTRRVARLLPRQDYFYSVLQLMDIFSEQLKRAQHVFMEKEWLKGQSVYALSVGYLALYRLWASGEKATVWNRHLKTWEEVDKQEITHLKTLWKMKSGYQPPAMLGLPSRAQWKFLSKQKQRISHFADEIKPGFSKQGFTGRQAHIVFKKIDQIKKQLESSTLPLLVDQIPDFQQDKIPFIRLQHFFRYLERLLVHSAEMTFVSLNRQDQTIPSQNKTFLFMGPFAVISQDEFFYRKVNDGKLYKMKASPGFEFELQAQTLFKRENGLLPLDPFHSQGISQTRMSMFSSFGNWLIFLTGSMGCVLTLLMLFRVWFIYRKTHTLLKHLIRGRRKKVIRLLRPVFNVKKSGKKESWINELHNMLTKEKCLQKKMERWLVWLLLLTLAMGSLLFGYQITSMIMGTEIKAENVVQLLTAPILMTVFTITLIMGRALVLVCHRALLSALENAGWTLLFNKKT